MTKKNLSLFAALLCVYVNLYAQTYSASILFDNPPVSTTITLNGTGGDSNWSNTIKSGVNTLQTIDYAYFQVNKSAIATADNNLIFDITYFDEGTGRFSLHYNAVTENYKQSNFNLTGTNQFVTATIALTDAAFKGAQNGGADFRIESGVFIREIKIRKGELNPDNEAAPDYSGVEKNDWSEFTGKSVTGYQMWFSTGDENSGWFHWNATTRPQPGKLNFEVYPDVSEYEDAALAQTGFANLGNGEPARLFSSANSQVVQTHFKWLKDADIDGVAIQRFVNGLGKTIINSDDALLKKAQREAEINERLFYICYDISGSDSEWANRIKFDWVYNIEQTFALTQSPAYAKVGSKPVVQLWGTGFVEGIHPGSAAETIALIQFLQARGCYVIGGVPTWWRTETGDSKPDFIEAYNAYDMLSPWLVGRFTDNAGADDMFARQMQGDKAYCDSHSMDYMPVIFPGFAWSQWNGSASGTSGNVNEMPRNAGEFMWHQAKNIKNLGASQMYFAMFDEYDEGTALMKAATDWTMIPTDQYFLTTSADGYWLSSDFQLRVAGAAISMLKSTEAAPANVPVPHSEGPVYYRNSFESRTTDYNFYNGSYHDIGTFPLDPCFKNETQLSASGVSGQATEMITFPAAKSGLYVAQITGNATSATGSYYYQFADAKIKVKADMELSFSKYALNESGKYASVSLRFDDGTYLHNISLTDTDCIGVSPENARGNVGQWTEHTIVIGQNDLIGKTITGILFGYAGNSTGNFDAYFDNLLIQDGSGSYGDCIGTALTQPNSSIKLYAANGQIFASGGNTTITVFDMLGKEIANHHLKQGIYIVKAEQNGKIETHKIMLH
ncbi:MAG: T9SS type A sorting domain-containing protein [Prevotellaceae bacterium]|jgi:hypothetical protein|nr:T9SS type A sorting domain-containing protein [Prevotellaceae bacterium]